MKIRELTCINCPLGCALAVTLDGEKVIKVEGNTCPKGKTYGEKEVTNPTRILTSSVTVIGGKLPVVSVKTASDIPKNKIRECAASLKNITIQAPVKVGDVVLENIGDTGVELIATKNVESR